MKVITCNIYFSSMPSTGVRIWANRRQHCFDTILSVDPDVICLQECQIDQLADFKAYLGRKFECVHANSYPSLDYPENPIFFRCDRFRNEGVGAWGLSETPHIPGVKGWGSECVRFVNWVLLSRPDGSLVRVVNTHFDHASQLARDKSSQLVNEDAAAWDQAMPQILTGDLNGDPHSHAMQLLEEGGWKDSLEGPHKFETTYHDFRGTGWRPEDEVPYCGTGRMDYVYYRGDCRLASSEIIHDSPDNVHFASDHYFVAAELE